MNDLTLTNAEIFRASTDAAGLCREIVLKTVQTIQGRKYVRVEGWQAIAVAHGCAASADHVERIEDGEMSGFRAMGIVRRMSDGAEIARAEGFLGDDEAVWAKRPVYARRAMVQTRAISRACRSAFAHVVVLIDGNLSTTPAEEVPDCGFDDRPALRDVTPPRATKVDPRKLDDEMDACRSQAALLVWEKSRTAQIRQLTKEQGDALAAKFKELHRMLPKTEPDLSPQDVPDFAS